MLSSKSLPTIFFMLARARTIPTVVNCKRPRPVDFQVYIKSFNNGSIATNSFSIPTEIVKKNETRIIRKPIQRIASIQGMPWFIAQLLQKPIRGRRLSRRL